MAKTILVLERLKVCYYVLTKRYFYFQCYSKDFVEHDEEGYAIRKKKNQIKGFYHIEDIQFNKYTLRDLICEHIIRVVQKIKSKQI